MSEKTLNVNLAAVADAKMPHELLLEILETGRLLKDGEARKVGFLMVEKTGGAVQVMPQVPKACPRCGASAPSFGKDGRKKCAFVRCGACGLTVEAESAAEAAAKWNVMEAEPETLPEDGDGGPFLIEMSVEKLRHAADVLGTVERSMELRQKFEEFDVEAQYNRLLLVQEEAELREELCVLDGDLAAAAGWQDSAYEAWQVMELYGSGSHEDFRACATYHLTPERLKELRRDPAAYLDGYRMDKDALREAVYVLDGIGAEVPEQYREMADAPKVPRDIEDVRRRAAEAARLRALAAKVREHNRWRRSQKPYNKVGAESPVSPAELGDALEGVADAACLLASAVEAGKA